MTTTTTTAPLTAKKLQDFYNSYITHKALTCANDIPWDWKAWSSGPCCSPLVAIEHPDKDWDWDALTKITDAATMLQHPDLPWQVGQVRL